MLTASKRRSAQEKNGDANAEKKKSTNVFPVLGVKKCGKSEKLVSPNLGIKSRIRPPTKGCKEKKHNAVRSREKGARPNEEEEKKKR